MDMSRIITVLMMLALTALPAPAFAAEPAPSLLQSIKPGDSGHAQPESCFGASNEKDEDLKTGNESAVYEALRLLLGPGT